MSAAVFVKSVQDKTNLYAYSDGATVEDICEHLEDNYEDFCPLLDFEIAVSSNSTISESRLTSILIEMCNRG